MDGDSSAAGSDQRVFSPQDVATTFGISTAGLRRLAPSYERIYGELPRDPRLGRMWPQEAVDRLSTARAAVQQGGYVSVEQALAALRDGAEPLETMPARGPAENAEATLVQQLLTEIRGLREAVERQNTLIEQQGERLTALESPTRGADSPVGRPEEADAPETVLEPQEPSQAPWWRRIFGA